MQASFSTISGPDLLAPFFFLLCWAGYSALADGPIGSRRSLMSRIHEHRLLWMRLISDRREPIGPSASAE